MDGYKTGLVGSMILSILCLLGIIIDYRGYVGFILSFVIIIPGFLRIYFTTKTTMKKYVEWTLLVVNYLFATTLSGWYFIHAFLDLYK